MPFLDGKVSLDSSLVRSINGQICQESAKNERPEGMALKRVNAEAVLTKHKYRTVVIFTKFFVLNENLEKQT